MPISKVGENSSANATTSAITVNLPGGVAQDDVAYAGGMSNQNSNINCTEGSGTYTELADLFASDTSFTNAGLYRKVQGSTPDSSVTLTLRSNGGSKAALVVVLRGVDTTNPEDVAAATATGIDSGTPDGPSATAATAGAWSTVWGFSTEGGSALSNPPTGYSDLLQIQDSGVRNVMWARKELSSAGAENPPAFSDVVGDANDSWCAVTVIVKPAAASGITGTGALSAQAAAVSGDGTSGSTGSGAAAGQAATVAGSGVSGSTGSGAASAGGATVAGIGTVGSDAITGSGALQAGAASVAGAGTSGSIGSGALVANDNQVAGAGVSGSIGYGALQAGPAIVAGSQVVPITGPIPRQTVGRGVGRTLQMGNRNTVRR